MPISLGILARSQKRSGGTGGISAFTWGDSGLFGAPSTRTYNASGGSGSGATFEVVRSGGGINSPVTAVNLVNPGTNYTVGNILTVTENVSPNDVIEITVTAVT